MQWLWPTCTLRLGAAAAHPETAICSFEVRTHDNPRALPFLSGVIAVHAKIRPYEGGARPPLWAKGPTSSRGMRCRRRPASASTSACEAGRKDIDAAHVNVSRLRRGRLLYHTQILERRATFCLRRVHRAAIAALCRMLTFQPLCRCLVCREAAFQPICTCLVCRQHKQHAIMCE